MVFGSHDSDPDRNLDDSALGLFASHDFDSAVPLFMSEANSARLEQTESIADGDYPVGFPLVAVDDNFQDYPDREHSWASFGLSLDRQSDWIGYSPDPDPQIWWPEMIHSSDTGVEPVLEELTPWIPSSASSASYFSDSPHSSVGWYHDTSSSGIQKRKATRAMEPVNGTIPSECMRQINLLPSPSNVNVHKDNPAPDITIGYPGDQTCHSQPQRDHSDLGRYRCGWEGCASSGSFPTESTLWRHIKSTHVSPNQFKCPDPSCRKSYGRRDKMKTHMQMVHGKSG